jgi:hypothetical protein
MNWPEEPGTFEFRLRWDGHDAAVHVCLQPPEVKGSVRWQGRDEAVTGRFRGFRAVEDGDKSLLSSVASVVSSALESTVGPLWKNTVGRVVPVPDEVLMMLRPPGGVGVQLDLEVPGEGLALALRFQTGLPVTSSFRGSITYLRVGGCGELQKWALAYAECLDRSLRPPDRIRGDDVSGLLEASWVWLLLEEPEFAARTVERVVAALADRDAGRPQRQEALFGKKIADLLVRYEEEELAGRLRRVLG